MKIKCCEEMAARQEAGHYSSIYQLLIEEDGAYTCPYCGAKIEITVREGK